MAYDSPELCVKMLTIDAIKMPNTAIIKYERNTDKSLLVLYP